jgi:hypothetical protein
VETDVVVADSTAMEAVESSIATRVAAVANAGATKRTPKPNRASDSSETRLKIVSVEMFSLSLVESLTIGTLAWAEINPS